VGKGRGIEVSGKELEVGSNGKGALFREEALKEAELFLKTFSDHFSYHRDTIFQSLLDKPDKYLTEYCKLINVILSSFKQEEKANIQVNNYVNFFEEVSSLSKKIDSGEYRLTKNIEGDFELVK